MQLVVQFGPRKLCDDVEDDGTDIHQDVHLVRLLPDCRTRP